MTLDFSLVVCLSMVDFEAWLWRQAHREFLSTLFAIKPCLPSLLCDWRTYNAVWTVVYIIILGNKVPFHEPPLHRSMSTSENARQNYEYKHMHYPFVRVSPRSTSFFDMLRQWHFDPKQHSIN